MMSKKRRAVLQQQEGYEGIVDRKQACRWRGRSQSSTTESKPRRGSGDEMLVDSDSKFEVKPRPRSKRRAQWEAASQGAEANRGSVPQAGRPER